MLQEFDIPSSKSQLNRLQICQLYSSDLKIKQAGSLCLDSIELASAIEALKNNTKIHAGAAGTSLRFLLPALSRIKGQHFVYANAQIMSRPQQDLIITLNALGINIEMKKDHFVIEGGPWKQIDTLKIAQNISSQFVSGILLNAWDLEFDLKIELSGKANSMPYLEMSIDILKSLGMQIDFQYPQIFVPKKQKITVHQVDCELDFSSIASLLVLAQLNAKNIYIKNFPWDSTQADAAIVGILKNMGAKFHRESNTDCWFEAGAQIIGQNIDFSQHPDLFPILCALASFAKTDSNFTGLESLAYKESNRLEASMELLTINSIPHQLSNDRLCIMPSSENTNVTHRNKTDSKSISFNSRHDHRMAMAASMFISKSFNLEVTDPNCVDKSFPQYWSAFQKITGRSL